MTMRGDWEQRKLDEREVSGTEQAGLGPARAAAEEPICPFCEDGANRDVVAYSCKHCGLDVESIPGRQPDRSTVTYAEAETAWAHIVEGEGYRVEIRRMNPYAGLSAHWLVETREVIF